MSRVHYSPSYIVKEVTVEMMNNNPAQLIADMEGEAVHSALARALGFDVPAMSIRVFPPGASGADVKAVYYVIRRIEGDILATRPLGEIFQYRDDLARHRALALLVGDWDRHLKNYMISKEGRFFPLDAGVADPTGLRYYSFDDPVHMQGFYGRDHWLVRRYREVQNPSAAKPVRAMKGLLAEEMLTYNRAVEDTVDKILDFVTGARQAELRAILEGAYGRVHANNPHAVRQAVENTMAAMRARAQTLDKVMRELNERNGVPLEPGGGGR